MASSVFCNRSRDKLKTLVWEHNGFRLLLFDLLLRFSRSFFCLVFPTT
ncbi:IS66 family insertion sequence element accessory protein TnpB [Bacillus pseudomycoides]